MHLDDSQLPEPDVQPQSETPLEAELIEDAEPVVMVQPVTRPPHPNFWWSLLWCFGFLLVTQVGGAIVGAFVGIGILMVRLGGPQEFLDGTRTEEGKPLLLHEITRDGIIFSQILAIGMAVLVLTLVVGRRWPRQLALRLPAPGHVLLALLGAPAMIVLGTGIQSLAAHFLPSFSSLGIPGADEAIQGLKSEPAYLLVLMIGVGPAIGEELWCRGFLGRGLVGHYGVVGGVLLTSFLFGAIHLDPPQAVMAMVMGVFLHFAYLTTRSLWVPMMLHYINNSIGVFGLTDRMPALKALDDVPTWPPTMQTFLLFGSAVLLLAAVGWALYRSRARLVSEQDGTLWHPPHPGVASPAPGSGASVVWTWPGWAEAGMVGLALAGFVTVSYQLVAA